MNADVGRLSPADQGSGVRDPTDAEAHRFTAEDGQETSASHVNWADRSPTLIAEANHIKTLTHAPPLMAHTHRLPPRSFSPSPFRHPPCQLRFLIPGQL